MTAVPPRPAAPDCSDDGRDMSRMYARGAIPDGDTAPDATAGDGLAIAEAERRGYERARRDYMFAPSGDNHHNAALCPYCSPALRDVLAAAARDAEAVARVRYLADAIADEAVDSIWHRDTLKDIAARISRALDVP